MRPAGLALVTAAMTGWATAIAMLGPLLLDLSRDLGVPLGLAGLLGGVTWLPWALEAPATGLLSDRVGRRPLMVLALGGVGLSSIGAAFAAGFPSLVATRLLAGAKGPSGRPAPWPRLGTSSPCSGGAARWPGSTWASRWQQWAECQLSGFIAGWFGWRWSFVTVGLVLLLLRSLVQAWFPAPPPTRQTADLCSPYRNVLGVTRLGNVLGANLLERAMLNAAALYLPAFLMVALSSRSR